METAHKQPKQGNILLSSGRDGAADVIEYKKCVLTQLFQNEVYDINSHLSNIKIYKPVSCICETKYINKLMQPSYFPSPISHPRLETGQ